MTEAMNARCLPTAGPGAFSVPAIQRDDWVACRNRARSILQAPGLLLPWLFGLVFGITYAVIAEDSAGWALAGVLAALMLVVVGASHMKFWVTSPGRIGSPNGLSYPSFPQRRISRQPMHHR